MNYEKMLWNYLKLVEIQMKQILQFVDKRQHDRAALDFMTIADDNATSSTSVQVSFENGFAKAHN